MRAALGMILLGAALSGPVAARPFGSPGRMTPVARDANTSGFGFWEYLPPDYDTASRWPLVLYFHGSGEKGNGTTDLRKLLATGVPALLRDDADASTGNDVHRPFLLIAPQDSTGWPAVDRVWSLVEFVKARYAVDTNRIYVTGVSRGGGETWGLLEKYGSRFAAAAPICGAGWVPADAHALQALPIWAFHAFDDPIVRLSRSLVNVDRIAKATDSAIRAYPTGSVLASASGTRTLQFNEVRGTWSCDSGTIRPRRRLALTIYESGGHDSWTRTYADERFWAWLLSQSRAGPPLPPVEPLREEPDLLVTRFSAGGLELRSHPASGSRAVQAFDITGRKFVPAP